MFIKIASGVFVNTDHVRFVRINETDESAILEFDNSTSSKRIGINVARYLLTCLEAQAALIEQEPETPSLKTRVAQALRWEFPYGATLQDLQKIEALTNTDPDEILSALAELFNEKAIKRSLVEPIIYIHASNYTLTRADAIAMKNIF